jgi:hypothetical protein
MGGGGGETEWVCWVMQTASWLSPARQGGVRDKSTGQASYHTSSLWQGLHL